MPAHRQKGAYTHKLDRAIVPGLAHLCRLAQRDKGVSYFETIRRYVDSVGLDIVGGRSRNAAVHRLYSKVLKYRRARPEPLRGLPHWSRYTLDKLD